METQAIVEKLENLPVKDRETVLTFIDFLARKAQGEEPPARPKRLGALKGMVKYMAPDFDEPLEDFKDYM